VQLPKFVHSFGSYIRQEERSGSFHDGESVLATGQSWHLPWMSTKVSTAPELRWVHHWYSPSQRVFAQSGAWQHGRFSEKLSYLKYVPTESTKFSIRLKLVLAITVALIKFASNSLLTKVHLKKKSGVRKTRRYLIGNQIPF
jgi:hypothetical protein